MGREIPYQPIKGPQKQVSQADMLKILEKHAQRLNLPPPQTPVVVENTAPTRVLPSLEWEKPTPGATGLRTVCGRYSCSKITVNGKTTYELWRLVPNHWFKQIAIGLESFEVAKKRANEDAQRKTI